MGTCKTNIETINLEGGISIIPNPVIRINGMGSQYREFNQKTLELNGYELSDADLSQNVWIYLITPGRDPHDETNIIVDNFSSTGYKTKDTNGNNIYIMERGAGTLPRRLLENVKEGDIINIKLPGVKVSWDDDSKEEIIINLKLTADQLDWRYGRFGKFEEAFAYCG